MNLLLAVVLGLSMAQNAATPDLHDVIQKAFHNLEQNRRQAENYTFQERSVVRTLDGGGALKKTEVRTFDVLWIDGSQQRRLIARDDHPLSADEARKVEQEFDKAAEKRRNQSASERQKRLEKETKAKKEGEELIHSVLDAYDFRFAGHDTVSGISCVMIDATPRAAYQGHDRATNLLKHISGRMWITEENNQLVKVDAVALDNIRFGWFLATVSKGAQISFEQVRINDEVWLPAHSAVKISARALFKKMNIEQETSYSGYKKFRVDTKVTGAIGAAHDH